MVDSLSHVVLPKDGEREKILNDFQAITGLNIEDAILFLDEYNWKLDIIINDYYTGIELKQKLDHNPNLGRYYSNENEDSDRHYAELLNYYGDTDKWRKQQQQIQPIYHEKQRLLRCGLHSLNNLFQIPKLFTHHNLEKIVCEYDKRLFFNDYRTLWLGNYDLRILIEAIRRFDFDVQQIDIYNGKSLENILWENFFGLLINLNGTHWFTIKNLNKIYYNLDSTLRKPLKIGEKKDLIKYLIHLIYRNKIVYLFVVVQKE